VNSLDQELHRLVKHAIDSGAAATLEEARAMFDGYALGVLVDDAAAADPAYQNALLTTVALGRRVFLGGVHVSGALAGPVEVELPLEGTLGDAVLELGGRIATPAAGTPTVGITKTPQARVAGFHVRPAFSGWRGGVLPIDADAVPTTDAMPLAPMLSAALAVSEAFSHVADLDRAAGRRPVGLSLWDPTADWLVGGDGPTLELLPKELWLVGLGHLGQAYLWALGLLPYEKGQLELVLQDTDVISASTESTSILTSASMVGIRKTRAMATWADRRGFGTSIHERLFDAAFRRQDREPAVALCGVDNGEARRAFDGAGFPLVVEAGLGRDHRSFRTMRLHTLPGPKRAVEMWRRDTPNEDVATKPAYEKLLADGAVDRCGVTVLAGKAVGAPFVGAVAATHVISQLLRHLHGARMDAVLDLDLASPEFRASVLQRETFDAFNPGYVRCSRR
jgi:hypothetical protein